MNNGQNSTLKYIANLVLKSLITLKIPSANKKKVSYETDWVIIWGLFEKWTIIAAFQLAKLKRSHFINSLMERE